MNTSLYKSMDTRALNDLARQQGFNVKNPTRDDILSFLISSSNRSSNRQRSSPNNTSVQQVTQQMQQLSVKPLSKQEVSYGKQEISYGKQEVDNYDNRQLDSDEFYTESPIINSITSNIRSNPSGINKNASFNRSFNNNNNNSSDYIYRPPISGVATPSLAVLNNLTPTIIDDNTTDTRSNVTSRDTQLKSNNSQSLEDVISNFRKSDNTTQKRNNNNNNNNNKYDNTEIEIEEPIKITNENIPVKIPTPVNTGKTSARRKSPASTDDPIVVAQDIDINRLTTGRANGNTGPYKIDELKDFARRLAIPSYSRAKKDELVDAIRNKLKSLGINV